MNVREAIPTLVFYIINTMKTYQMQSMTSLLRRVLYVLSFGILAVSNVKAQSYYSFENGEIPDKWKADKCSLAVSAEKYKLGKRSLKIAWKAGAKLDMPFPMGIEAAAGKKNGGIAAWLYNTKPVDAPLVFIFKDKEGRELGRSEFRLAFSGWRCYWQQFQEDMGMKPKSAITDVELRFPDTGNGGTVYVDYLEFSPNVSWQKMSDAQYAVNRTDFSLIPDFMRYRNAEERVDNVITATDNDIERISDRLTDWYLGCGTPAAALTETRKKHEAEFISGGVRLADEIDIKYAADGTPAGEPLYPLCSPAEIDGEHIRQFRNINEKILLPLALDYRKNKNKKSLDKIRYIYDWFYDQGWADGSGLGTLCFEKLRSSGYFHSFFLVKDELDEKSYLRELNTLYWFTMFGICYDLPTHAGEVADNLRSLAIPKLVYALSVKDKERQRIALTAYKAYMDNALGVAPGFFGTFKADFSGYHHRGAYHSAYYTHALYAGALTAYLLHDTPYALSAETLNNLKKGLLTFRFFSANLEIPSGTVGRFPMKQEVLHELLPAFAYLALATAEPDRELVAAFKRIIGNEDNRTPILEYARSVDSNLAYTATVGETELMEQVASLDIAPEADVEGNLFMPYSGLMVMKDVGLHFNVKGFNRYVWDFESSATENLKGRYLAYGQLEYFDLKHKRKSFRPAEEGFDWNHIPGTTVKYLSDAELVDKGGSSSGHRHFSDETFLAGVDGGRAGAMFSFRMHDISYDTSFRANKSVFAIGDYLLCLGSDIHNDDKAHNTVTTLFQSFDEAWKEENGGSYLLGDGSLLYALKADDLAFDKEGKRTCAYIRHGKAPEAAAYEYYIIKNNSRKLAGRLLSKKSPVRVISRDNDAHIVEDTERGIVCGALFNAGKRYEGLTVKQVNIPLAYIVAGDKEHKTLSICEPDMRRISRDHMGLLSEADVIDEEKPFDTVLTLNGLYDVTCEQKEVSVSRDREKRETYIKISTIRGENYRLQLRKGR